MSSKKPYLFKNFLPTSFSSYPLSQLTNGDKFEIKLCSVSNLFSPSDFQSKSLFVTFILLIFFSFKTKSFGKLTKSDNLLLVYQIFSISFLV